MMTRKERERAEARTGWAMLAGVAIATAALLYGAYLADAARGISIGASLASWGL